MTIQYAVDIVQDTLLTSLIVIAPLVVVAIGVGLIVSLLQSITSIQEQTLTFIPKLVAVCFVMIITANWMVMTVVDFTIRHFEQIQNMAP